MRFFLVFDSFRKGEKTWEKKFKPFLHSTLLISRRLNCVYRCGIHTRLFIPFLDIGFNEFGLIDIDTKSNNGFFSVKKNKNNKLRKKKSHSNRFDFLFPARLALISRTVVVCATNSIPKRTLLIFFYLNFSQKQIITSVTLLHISVETKTIKNNNSHAQRQWMNLSSNR